MASDTDDLVLSISADTRQIMNAIKRLEKAVGASAGQLEKSFAGVGKGIDKSFDTSVQKRINEITGVGTKATKEWAGALADQGKELERMRSRFNPIFSTISRYKATVGEIQTAHRLGAISADEMAAAIQRERQAALSSIAAIKQRNAAIADTPVRSGVSNFNSANIAAQFQDIGVTMAMGQSPMTIALQQGTQLSAILNQMGGTKDVIKGLGAAFLSIVNPVSLVTIGVIGATAAAYQYFTATEDGAANSEKALKEQIELIDNVAKKWGDALPAIRAYANEQDRLAGRADADTAFKKLAGDTFGKIRKEVSAAGEGIKTLMDKLSMTSLPGDQFAGVRAALDGLSKSASENKTTVEELDAAHKALMDAFQNSNLPILKDVADAFSALRPELEATTAELQRQAGQKSLTDAFVDLQAAIGNISSAKARDELASLMDQTKKGEISVADLLTELSRISGYAPDVSGIISAFRLVAETIDAASRAASAFTGKESQGGRVRYHSGAFMQLPGDNAPTPERAPNREDVAAENARRAEREARKGRTGAPKRTADDRFFEDIEAIRQRTRALAEEQSMIGMTFEAQTKRRVAFDLETQALKQVREEARKKGEKDWQNAQLSPDQVKAIDEVSAAYARQADELRKAQEAMDLQRDVLKGAFSDFRSAIEDGKLDWKDFANIAMNALDKIIDKIENDLIDAIMQANSLLGGGASSGGGIPWAEDIFRASGGPVKAGQPYIVGEKRPELFVPNQSGTIVPRVPDLVAPQSSSAISVTFAPSIVMQGGSDDAGEQVTEALKKFEKEFTPRVVKSLREARTRGMI